MRPYESHTLGALHGQLIPYGIHYLNKLSACQVKYHIREIAINENHFQVFRQKQKVICCFVLQHGGNHAILLEQ